MNGTHAASIRRPLARDVAVMAAVALVLTLLAPFGTIAFPFAKRLLIWLAFVFGGFLCFRPVVAGGRALSEHTRLPQWVGIGCAVLLASLPATLIVVAILAGTQMGDVSLKTVALLYPQVVLIGGLITGLQRLLRRDQPETPAPVAAPVTAPAPPIATEPSRETPPPNLVLEKLSPALGTDILYVANEDHYVRVHTALGNDLILMRMGDAVSALATMDGARVHRGWWVARAAVAEVVKADRTIRLKLIDGTEVPVARGMVAQLRQSGWL